MKKIFSYQLEESDLGDLTTFKMNELVHFSIIPHHDYLNEEDKKIINSLISGEKVYTQKMYDSVKRLIKCIQQIITNKEEIAWENLNYNDQTEASHYRILLENYNQQQQKLKQLAEVFKVT